MRKLLPLLLVPLLLGASCSAPQTSSSDTNTPPAAVVAPPSSDDGPSQPPTETSDERPADSLVKVTRVIDGDTIDLAGGTRVRIIGIDTPETKDPRTSVQCFGVEATNRMNELVAGKMVRLETNPGDTTDKYGRELRYVILDKTDVGAEMIRGGYAFAYRDFPHPRMDQYVQLEAEARNAKRGLWAAETCNGNPTAAPEPTPAPTTTTPPPPEPRPEPEPSSSPTPTPDCACSSNIYNCTDFSSSAEAQAVYNCCFNKVGYDVHGLDRDKDGLACESK